MSGRRCAGVSGFRGGRSRRLPWGPIGAYADERLLLADNAVAIPAAVSDEEAAALMVKGGTAYYLLHDTWPLKAGESALVHAAAGGVGSLLAQWGSAIGARIIHGTAGSAEKLSHAEANGCDVAIDYRQPDWPQKVREATLRKGADVIYDGVRQGGVRRQHRFAPAAAACWRAMAAPQGYVTIPNLGALANKGSLYVTRPTARHYLGTPETLRVAMAAVFAALEQGKIRVSIDQRFALRDAAEGASRPRGARDHRR